MTRWGCAATACRCPPWRCYQAAGSRLASGDDGDTVRLWDVARSGDATAVMEGHGGRVLALALQFYEDGLCAGCGLPASRAHNADMEGWYTPVTTKCWACAAREAEAEAAAGQGVIVGVVDESYAKGYEPRSTRGPQESNHEQGQAQERDQPPDGR